MDSATTLPGPARVWPLALGLLVAAAALSAYVLVTFGAAATAPALVGAVAVGYVLTERFPVLYRAGDDAFAITLTELVMTAAFFLLGPAAHLAARAAAAVVVAAAERGRAPVKRAFNLSLTLLESALAIAVLHSAVPTPDLTDPVTWGSVLLAVTLAVAVDTVALRVALRRATGVDEAMRGVAVAGIVGIATASSLAVMVTLLLLEVRPAASLLMIGPGVALVVGYQGHVRMVNELLRTRSMYELASRLTTAPKFDAALVAALTEVRAALRVERAELLLLAGGPEGSDVLISIDADGEIRTGGPEDAHPAHAVTIEEGSHGDASTLGVPVEEGNDLIGSMVLLEPRPERGRLGSTDTEIAESIAAQIAGVAVRVRLSAQLRTTEEARDYLASHDALTGLAGRGWFIDHVRSGADRPGGAAVVLMNLRGFREINERLGAVAGDRVLAQVAERLRTVAGDVAELARLGGDEFAFVTSADRARGLAARAATAVSRPHTIRGEDVVIGASVGVASWPVPVRAPGQLLRAADVALTEARTLPVGAIVEYDEELEARASRRRRLTADLRTALATEDALLVQYQPLVDLRSRAVVGAEALVRWRHHDLGDVSPAEFVAIAEETGQVRTLTTTVLDRACAQAAAWHRAGLQARVSVNVSGHDLGSDGRVVEMVSSTLSRHGLPPRCLTIELTETAAMTDPIRAMDDLQALSALGVGLAIDDFGTGHSSLAYLARLPVTAVKIDQSFVADLMTSEESLLVVQAVVGLADARGLDVIAEGIESEDVAATLRRLGVRYGQGFHLGRPMTAAELATKLEPAQGEPEEWRHVVEAPGA